MAVDLDEIKAALTAAALPTERSEMTIQIRKYNYHGDEGFLICGTDSRGRKPKVFTLTRNSAERIREKLKAGVEIGLEDFAP